MRGELRIIGGSFRGRKWRIPDHPAVRPTPDRMRETLFNWLMMDIQNAYVLDLFSGSGALAWEALSRGAASVVLVESQAQICTQLKQVAKDFKIEDKAQVIQADIHKWLQSSEILFKDKTFDLVFLDPPFQKGLVVPILNWIYKWKSQPALVYVESELSWEQLQPELLDWECLKSTRSGESFGMLLRINKINI